MVLIQLSQWDQWAELAQGSEDRHSFKGGAYYANNTLLLCFNYCCLNCDISSEWQGRCCVVSVTHGPTTATQPSSLTLILPTPHRPALFPLPIQCQQQVLSKM